MTATVFPASFLDELNRAVMDRDGKAKGSETIFRCPIDGHEDTHPSARWNPKKFTFFCDACGTGGGALALADLLGVEKPERKKGTPRVPSQKRVVHSYTPNLTVAELALAKRIDEGFLRSIGVSDVRYGGGKAVRIVYFNEDGSESAIRYRTSLAGQDRFKWKSGARVRLYGLDRLRDAVSAGYVVLNEGESDTWTCWQARIPAIGVPGASNWRDDRDAVHLDGVPAIYVVIEPDQGGEAFRDRLTKSRIRDRLYLIDLSPFGVKDLSDLYLDDPARFNERFEEAQTNAVAYADVTAEEAKEACKALYESAYESLYESDILRLVRDAVRAGGYAGNLDPTILAYVAISSRLLDSPLNVAFIAPSAAGKNRAIDAARALVPEDAVYEIRAGSARALIYNDASFEHRVVLFSEADSIPEDGPAASAVRNIASDNEMSYEVVERDETTGQQGVRVIRKPGPTALMTTSTRSLRHQFDTRVLEVSIPDDADQTRAVMRAHASSVMPTSAQEVDTGPLIALQQWLELAGDRNVAVPFAEALAGLLPAGAVRMRRDFRQLLTFVQAIALLHQRTRARTEEGWIVATVDDYEAARQLLSPVFDVSTSEGVTPAIREVVAAIEPPEEVSLSTLAERIKLAKTTVSWRTSRAIRGGWLVNNEPRKGHPAKFARGTPLPDEVSALPTVAALLEVYECTSVFREEGQGVPLEDVVEFYQEPEFAYAANGTAPAAADDPDDGGALFAGLDAWVVRSHEQPHNVPGTARDDRRTS